MAGGALYSLSHRPSRHLNGSPPNSNDNPVGARLQYSRFFCTKNYPVNHCKNVRELSINASRVSVQHFDV